MAGNGNNSSRPSQDLSEVGADVTSSQQTDRTSESDDMDYEPATEVDTDSDEMNSEALINHLLEEHGGLLDDEDDEDGRYHP